MAYFEDFIEFIHSFIFSNPYILYFFTSLFVKTSRGFRQSSSSCERINLTKTASAFFNCFFRRSLHFFRISQSRLSFKTYFFLSCLVGMELVTSAKCLVLSDLTSPSPLPRYQSLRCSSAPIRGRPNPPPQGEGRELIDRKNIITACLLHDMGNIIKFDLSFTDKLNPGKFTKNDLTYWQKVKDAYIQKYGPDVHQASILVAKELGVNDRIIELIDCISFLGAPQNAKGAGFGKKIMQYSDDRVGPMGVVSLEERFADLRKRYIHHKTASSERDDFENAVREIEKQIFEHCKIRPEDITEEAIKPYIERLKNYKI